MSSHRTRLYVCPRCITPWGEPGQCTTCHIERVACEPGLEGDPKRKPLIASSGELMTRAPAWWLVREVPELVKRHLVKD